MLYFLYTPDLWKSNQGKLERLGECAPRALELCPSALLPVLRGMTQPPSPEERARLA